jgi:hypothetical protein
VDPAVDGLDLEFLRKLAARSVGRSQSAAFLAYQVDSVSGKRPQTTRLELDTTYLFKKSMIVECSNHLELMVAAKSCIASSIRDCPPP